MCPWNNPRRAAVTDDPAFQPINGEPLLEDLASLSEEEFNARFSGTPIERSRYTGFLRNVAVTMGNSANPRFRDALERMAHSPDGSSANMRNGH